MRFKINENMATEIAVFLRSQGHDAMSVVEKDMAGAEVPELAAVIQGEQRILATLDLDFADIRRYPPSEYAGLLVFRVRRRDPDSLLGLNGNDSPNNQRHYGYCWHANVGCDI